MLGILATGLLMRMTRMPARGDLHTVANYGLYALAVAALMYTQYVGAFVVLSHAVFIALRAIRHRKEAVGWLLASAAALILYAPWLPWATRQIVEMAHEPDAWPVANAARLGPAACGGIYGRRARARAGFGGTLMVLMGIGWLVFQVWRSTRGHLGGCGPGPPCHRYHRTGGHAHR